MKKQPLKWIEESKGVAVISESDVQIVTMKIKFPVKH